MRISPALRRIAFMGLAIMVFLVAQMFTGWPANLFELGCVCGLALGLFISLLTDFQGD